MYQVRVAPLFFRREHTFSRICSAEKMDNLWRRVFLLLFLSIIVYGVTAWFGLGMDIISNRATSFTFEDYEIRKLFFLIGRSTFGLVFALLILFGSPFLLWMFTGIHYRKLVALHLPILMVLLLERALWIVLLVNTGLDWYVSPLSFGIIASYITDIPWIIYFFGTISLVQLWIVWFQIKMIHYFSAWKRWQAWILVLVLHMIYWSGAAAIAHVDVYFL
ncbi:hypothetical protein [Pontibacillus salipaludis]|uniref:Yip1 domain-containing protein n=1 Tax=Pontibacillus salipaludis TaxID=1697394 RepID=A0ABQ1Q1V3_9BACI|nr:hypothetical protein [Pontibacillus salipaludis]GGD10442.1 hypothetical protein GCM10011389_17540 [Pontibacillus salipaludis]